LDPKRWVEEHGDVLFGFVAARVRDRVIAQDLVQETFLAAIKASEGFAGRTGSKAGKSALPIWNSPCPRKGPHLEPAG
jgi:hypothetical protein